ncbi:beta-galactosidase [Amycolatopsis sp. NPDC049253]|uniref:beta-galactosidase n=1 Tax=Amycolatopsis sp. NPDC049253 TaxID=3155274 RepID=UPI003439ACC8
MPLHSLRMATDPEPPRSGHLAMGDERVEVNSRYLLRDGRPWIPVSGEFHYSRYPREGWAAELRKLASAGLTAVSSYVIWLHHEETEHDRRFDGNLDLRYFAGLCAREGLEFIARIGPWVHGETRNGGLPDWVLAAGPVRADDPGYLSRVRGWYQALAEQLAGLPVLAIQLENELLDDPEHLLTLKRLARDVGLAAPLWTATGWAARLPQDEVLPLYGGYAETFWDGPETGWPEGCRTHYFFTHERDDQSIGADLRRVAAPASDVDPSRYPMATCELGGGMAVAYHRRPVVSADDVAALSLTKLGSGSNWHGYYVFHGGTNPIGRLHTMQESRETGYPNDLPVLSYDFQAPIGEYGQLRESYALLRKQALFIRDFADRLAPMVTVLPDDGPADVHDRDTLRWALRTDGEAGFLFVNNHQPYEPLPSHHGVRFTLQLPGGTITLPSEEITIPTGAYFCWPVNLDLGSVRLAWATAEPLRLLEDGTLVLAAVDGVSPEIVIEQGGSLRLISGFTPGPDCVLTVAGSRILVLAAEKHTEPAGAAIPVECVREAGPPPEHRGGDRGWAPTDFTAAAVYRIDAPAGRPLLRIAWSGDVARAYRDGRMIADQFYNGLPWELRTEPGELELRILPAPRDAPIYLPAASATELTRATVRSVHSLEA